MRLARATITLGFVSGLVIAVGCGKDFDALFLDGPQDSGTQTDGGPDVTSEGGTVTTDAGSETSVADAGFVCPPSSNTCENTTGLDASSGGTFATLCNGCNCNCPAQQCPPAEANKRCESTCSNGAICGVTCNLAGPCNLTCDRCQTSSYECTALATSCTSSCAAGAVCAQKCNGSGGCTMTCNENASCKLTCSATSTSCSLECRGGTTTECGNHVFTCRQSCN